MDKIDIDQFLSWILFSEIALPFDQMIMGARLEDNCHKIFYTHLYP